MGILEGKGIDPNTSVQLVITGAKLVVNEPTE
jgi:hypothetical protein